MCSIVWRCLKDQNDILLFPSVPCQHRDAARPACAAEANLNSKPDGARLSKRLCLQSAAWSPFPSWVSVNVSSRHGLERLQTPKPRLDWLDQTLKPSQTLKTTRSKCDFMSPQLLRNPTNQPSLESASLNLGSFPTCRHPHSDTSDARGEAEALQQSSCKKQAQ